MVGASSSNRRWPAATWPFWPPRLPNAGLNCRWTTCPPWDCNCWKASIGRERHAENEARETTEEAPATAGKPAHAAHRQFAKSILAATRRARTGPSVNMAAEAPEIVEKLEHLDDLVYDAMAGQSSALEQLQSVWPRLLKELGDPILAESREQYLRLCIVDLARMCRPGRHPRPRPGPSGPRRPLPAFRRSAVVAGPFQDCVAGRLAARACGRRTTWAASGPATRHT